MLRAWRSGEEWASDISFREKGVAPELQLRETWTRRSVPSASPPSSGGAIAMCDTTVEVKRRTTRVKVRTDIFVSVGTN